MCDTRYAKSSAYSVDRDFNTRVFLYNQYTKYFDHIDFWSHRSIWSDWPQYLCDGVHFNTEGNRKYFNSVCGAVAAAVNQLLTWEVLLCFNERTCTSNFSHSYLFTPVISFLLLWPYK